MGATAIEVEGVGKRYRLGEHHGTGTDLRETMARAAGRWRGRPRPEVREIWSLRDVSFAVGTGEALGVVGSNGAGKSTLLKVMNGITTPTVGRCRTRGRIGSLLEVGTGFHAELTGLENTYLNGAILGMSRREVTRRLDEIVAFAGLERFMDTPVKRYSSGMYLRLGFAVAAHMEADILLVDEVLAVGDAEFQRRCLGKMDEAGRSGRTVVFVSHDLDAMTRLCPTAVWLDRGTVRTTGPTADVVRQYLGTSRATPLPTSFDVDPRLAAQVVRGAIVDDSGAPVSGIPMRSAAWIELEVQVNTPVPRLDVSCGIVTESGVALLDESLRDVEHDAPLGAIGRYRLRCRVPDVLAPGHYHVNVRLGTTYDDIEWRPRALAFSVDGDDKGRSRHVRLGTPWHVAPAGADEPDRPR